MRTARYTWLGPDEGLPVRGVDALAATPGGALWVAGATAVARGVDGSWGAFAPPPIGRVQVLLAAGESTVWAGGTAGLALLRGGRWERHLPGVPVTVLVAAGTALWAGTADRGLMIVSDDKLDVFDEARGMLDADVLDVAIDRFGRVGRSAPRA